MVSLFLKFRHWLRDHAGETVRLGDGPTVWEVDAQGELKRGAVPMSNGATVFRLRQRVQVVHGRGSDMIADQDLKRLIKAWEAHKNVVVQTLRRWMLPEMGELAMTWLSYSE